MTDKPKTPDELAKAVQANFQAFINPETPAKGQVIYIKDYLTRKIEQGKEKAEAYKAQAIAIDNNSSDITKNPFAAPLLKKFNEEAESVNKLIAHLSFILNKEQEIVLSQQTKSNVTSFRPTMNWNLPGITPPK